MKAYTVWQLGKDVDPGLQEAFLKCLIEFFVQVVEFPAQPAYLVFGVGKSILSFAGDYVG
ncbi:hypothetical protein [Aliamphritea spongicola]|nr:hypothetical protein [Aliamphritea spongicola]